MKKQLEKTINNIPELGQIPAFKGLLSDKEIIELCNTDNPMLSPFISKQIKEVEGRKVISYGLSSYGYDIRINQKIKVRNNLVNEIDPKDCKEDYYNTVDLEFGIYKMKPYECILVESLEIFNIPKDVMGFCFGKSTYARSFLNLLVTPLEAGWSGKLVLELVNMNDKPLILHTKEGIAQIVFFRSNQCLTDYSKKDGKYQNQKDIQISKI